MRITYSEWKPGESTTAQDRLEQLVDLFTQLLLQTSGNVRDALEWMRYFDGRYQIFGPEMTLDMFKDELKARGLIEEDGTVLRPTNKAIHTIRRDALMEMFRSLRKAPSGAHDTPFQGSGTERTEHTKSYQFGDQATNINLTQTIQNAMKRSLREQGGVRADGSLELSEEDIEVYETEHQTRAATVVMIDISHSMILYGEDRITPAKKVALALSELIVTKFPKDQLFIVTFGDEAKLITTAELPFLEVGPFHTNTRAGLQLARQILRRTGNANKQIFLVTDGKPSAMHEPSGRIYKNSFGLDPRIVNKTLDEAMACRREKITITTFMVAQDPYLINFVEELTKANHGRAYYSGLNDLGQFVFVDYVRNRRKKYRGMSD